MVDILNKILYGDCRSLLKALPAASVDCCVTDPPYGYRFMGKKWDYEIPAVEIWEEVLRVLKPGAHILVACGTRTQHRMAVNIEDAGFEIRDVICWHYGSGFPKNLDISKAIDKAAGVEREITGEKVTGRANAPRSEGRNHVDCAGGQMTVSITVPHTDEAIRWSGWGTALKPATEFWTLARKPISEKTIAANVIEHGTGGLNIDASRIPTEDSLGGGSTDGATSKGIEGWERPWMDDAEAVRAYSERKKVAQQRGEEMGRFPANLILDDFMAAEMDRQSGKLTSGSGVKKRGPSNNILGKVSGGNNLEGYGDAGGASRFFYIAKPSAEERGDVKHCTVKPQALIQYLIKLICPIEPGRIVIDPFAGSGSHCLAAMKLGVGFIGMERDEKNCIEANERLTKELGLFK